MKKKEQIADLQKQNEELREDLQHLQKRVADLERVPTFTRPRGPADPPYPKYPTYPTYPPYPADPVFPVVPYPIQPVWPWDSPETVPRDNFGRPVIHWLRVRVTSAGSAGTPSDE